MKLLMWLYSLVLFLALSGLGHAQSVAPTKLILNERQPSNFFTIQNPTDQPLRYQVSLISYAMDEAGGVSEAPIDDFAGPYLRYGPRVVSVPPHGSQSVRIQALAHRPIGEYRAHMNFQPIEREVSVDAAQDALEAGATGFGVTIQMGFQVPIIVRSGPMELDLTFSDVAIRQGEQGESLIFRVLRHGSWSAQGNLKIYSDAQEVAQTRLVIYENLDEQTVQLALDDPSAFYPGQTLQFVYDDLDSPAYSTTQEVVIAIE